MAGYFENGSPFGVKIRDSLAGVTFTDYHWNLEGMSHQLTQAGMVIERLHEVPDVDRYGRAVRTRRSPWLIVVAKALGGKFARRNGPLPTLRLPLLRFLQ